MTSPSPQLSRALQAEETKNTPESEQTGGPRTGEPPMNSLKTHEDVF